MMMPLADPYPTRLEMSPPWLHHIPIEVVRPVMVNVVVDEQVGVAAMVCDAMVTLTGVTPTPPQPVQELTVSAPNAAVPAPVIVGAVNVLLVRVCVSVVPTTAPAGTVFVPLTVVPAPG